MSLREAMERETALFTHPDEFGESVEYAGRTVLAVVEWSSDTGSMHDDRQGVFFRQVVLHMASADAGDCAVGRRVSFQEEDWIVGAVSHAGGMHSITLWQEVS